MTYKLGLRSKNRLRKVHPDLRAVIQLAITLTEVDFTVLETLRTEERQLLLLKKGATWTMNSRHLTGHAADLGAMVGNKVRWDWHLYHKVSDAVMKAADELGVDIEWGGNWKTTPDGPHFQLSWEKYPKEEIKNDRTNTRGTKCLFNLRNWINRFNSSNSI